MSHARSAGLVYLFLVATGMFSLAYAPGVYWASGDAAATLAKLQANLSVFKWAIVAELACYASFVALSVLLYRALRHGSEALGLMLIGCVWVSVPMSFLAIGEKMAALDLLTQSAPSADAVMAHFERYKSILRPAELFWGLWLLPFGVLVLKTRAIPLFLGVMLVLGALSYVASVILPMFVEGYATSAIAKAAGIPSSIGEIGSALWLAIFGARAVPPSTD